MSLILFLGLQPDHILALAIGTLIFIFALILVTRNVISFSVMALFLIFALIAGFTISHYRDFKTTVVESSQSDDDNNFKMHVIQALDELKKEVATEKETIKHVANQVQEIFDQMDYQKQKLRNFIDETRDKFSQESEKKDDVR